MTEILNISPGRGTAMNNGAGIVSPARGTEVSLNEALLREPGELDQHALATPEARGQIRRLTPHAANPHWTPSSSS